MLFKVMGWNSKWFLYDGLKDIDFNRNAIEIQQPQKGGVMFYQFVGREKGSVFTRRAIFHTLNDAPVIGRIFSCLSGKRNDGSYVDILFDSPAYILNENGQTIEIFK